MNKQIKAWSFSLMAACTLAACQNTTVPLDGRIEVPPQFSQTEAARGSVDIGRWWQSWHDPVLSALVEQGLQQSPDVQIAVSRLNEARATSRMARADLGPQAGLSGSAGIVRGEIDNPLNDGTRALLGQFPQTGALADSRQSVKGNSLLGGASASWEPDIFGGKRSDADAAAYAALGVQEQLYGAQMLVAGDIADHYFSARAAQKRLQTASQNIAVMQRMAQYVQGRFQAGQATRYEVDEVQSRLAAVRAQQSTIQSEYDAAARAIAVLTGQTPQSFTLPESSVNVLAQQPAAPAGQTPQGMLERRPDIRAHAAQVNAYAAKLASAKADLLPRFTINFLGQGGRIEVDGDTALKGWGSLLSVGIQMGAFKPISLRPMPACKRRCCNTTKPCCARWAKSTTPIRRKPRWRAKTACWPMRNNKPRAKRPMRKNCSATAIKPSMKLCAHNWASKKWPTTTPARSLPVRK